MLIEPRQIVLSVMFMFILLLIVDVVCLPALGSEASVFFSILILYSGLFLDFPGNSF